MDLTSAGEASTMPCRQREETSASFLACQAVAYNRDEGLHLYNILFTSQPPCQTGSPFALIATLVQIHIIINDRDLLWRVYIRSRHRQLIECLGKLLCDNSARACSMRQS